MIITRLSTIEDIMKIRKGREFVLNSVNRSKEKEEHREEEERKSMGAGSDRMGQAMMMEMPLGSLISYGRMTEEALDELIEELNAE
ncbi:MAG: hypothetical protein Q4E89_12140 [Eubacteriales bacterium]|nr:hypothetical protein [Eubacteriales bacterium]